MNRSSFAFLFLLLSLFTASAFGQSDSTGQLLNYVKGIEGRDHDGRRQFVIDELRNLGVTWVAMPFDTVIRRDTSSKTYHGENIIVRMGQGARTIVIGAHYDAVPHSPGANDNGGGVAVLLGIIQSVRDHKFHNAVEFCFFDLEENGLLGSKAYVRQRTSASTHRAMINLDVEGMGDELYVGPVGGGDDDVLMKYLRKARKTVKAAYHEEADYPPSDHLSFAAAKLENISISVVPAGDSKKLANGIKNHFNFKDSTEFPVVLKVMHSPEDKSIHVSNKALMLSYEFTKAALLLLDEGER